MSMNIQLDIPEDLEEGFWDSKGYFEDADLRVGNLIFKVSFYDPVRLAQDIEVELKYWSVFLVENLIVVPEVTRKAMHNAIAAIISSGQLEKLKHTIV